MIVADIAWLAGLFDGEGCIHIYKRGNTSSYGLRISVGNVHLPTLERINTIFPGTLRRQKSSKKHSTWRIQYVWSVKSQDNRKFLELIKIYCICKQSDIITALKFLDVHQINKGQSQKDVSKIKEQLYLECRQNKKYEFKTDKYNYQKPIQEKVLCKFCNKEIYKNDNCSNKEKGRQYCSYFCMGKSMETFSDEIVEVIKKRYDNGETIKDLAKEFNINDKALHTRLYRKGIKKKTPYKRNIKSNCLYCNQEMFKYKFYKKGSLFCNRSCSAKYRYDRGWTPKNPIKII